MFIFSSEFLLSDYFDVKRTSPDVKSMTGKRRPRYYTTTLLYLSRTSTSTPPFVRKKVDLSFTQDRKKTL